LKKYKFWIYLTVIVLLSIATARFCHHQTKGFQIVKIQNSWDENVCGMPPLSTEEIDFVRSLFAYPFRYLGSGKQSFAFLSDDGTHVIKIFNNSHQCKIALFHILSYIPFFDNWASHKALLFTNKLEKAFESYRIAFEEMQDKTGLLFIHLGKTQELPPLTLIDALNIQHRLDSNELGFLIQKKAMLVYPALEEMIQFQEIDKAKAALCRLLDLFQWKFRHGICDNDPLIRTNFAILDDEVIQIDVGPLSKDFSTLDPDKMRAEMLRITASLKNWLSDRSPELAIFLDQQLQERL
jgi:hypothetical protein